MFKKLIAFSLSFILVATSMVMPAAANTVHPDITRTEISTLDVSTADSTLDEAETIVSIQEEIAPEETNSTDSIEENVPDENLSAEADADGNGWHFDSNDKVLVFHSSVPNPSLDDMDIPATIYDEVEYIQVEEGVKSFVDRSTEDNQPVRFEIFKNLKAVELPSGFSLTDYLFLRCYKLERVIFPQVSPDNPSEGCLNIPTMCFADCTALSEITIPDSVTKIKLAAFENCSSLSRITIPSKVTSIETRAFAECDDLVDVRVTNLEDPITVETGAFTNSLHAHVTCENPDVLSSFRECNVSTTPTDSLLRGSCGDEATYEFDITSGTLTIRGEGDMDDFYSAGGGNFTTYISYAPWYSFRNGITSIDIRDITSIGSCAFARCENLSTISWTDTITQIGLYAFDHCESLTNITIPSNVSLIHHYAFMFCHGLEEVTITSPSITIGNYAFNECWNLKQLTIQSLAADLSYANQFAGCENLSSVEIWATSPILSDGREGSSPINLFLDCSSELVIMGYGLAADSEPVAGNYVTPLANYAHNWRIPFESLGIVCKVTFQYNASDMEDRVLYCVTDKAIGHVANKPASPVDDKFFDDWYHNPEGGDRVTPESIFSEDSTVYGVWMDEDPDMIYDDYYTYSPATKTLTFTTPPGDEETNCWPTDPEIIDYVEKIVVSEGFTYMPLKPIYDVPSNLTSVTLPDGLTQIGDNAFNECGNLTEINLPDTLTQIGNYAFKECTKLQGIQLPSGLTSIGDCAFQSCAKLSSINLPNSLTQLGSYTFYKCTSLKSIEIPENVTVLPNGCFYGCSNLSDVSLHEGLITIQEEAFVNCSSLAQIELPESLTDIQARVFYICTALKDITIPAGVTYIAIETFSECSSLTTVNLPSGLIDISPDAFKNSPLLTTLAIPESMYIQGGLSLNFLPNSSIKTIEFPYDKDLSTSMLDTYGDVHFILSDVGAASLQDANGHSSVSYTIKGTSNYSGQLPGKLTWSLNLTNNTLTIDGTGTMPNYNYLSETADRLIYPEWYNHRIVIQKVILQDEVTSIGDYAFCSLPNLQTVTIYNPNTSIGEEAFPSSKVSLYSYTGPIADYANQHGMDFNIVGYIAHFDDSNVGGHITGKTEKEPLTKYILLGTRIIPIPDITTDDGYVFDGWYTQKTGGTKIPEVTTLDDEFTIYARWRVKDPDPTPGPTPTPYPTPDPNGGSSGSGTTDGSTPTTTVEILADGTKVETTIETLTDGTEQKTILETRPDGSKLEATIQTKTDGSQVENSKETKKDGTVTTTKKDIAVNGEKDINVVSKTKDKKKTTTANLHIASSGQVKKASLDVANVVSKKKMTINLNELKKLSDQLSVGNYAYVHPIGGKASPTTNGEDSLLDATDVDTLRNDEVNPSLHSEPSTKTLSEMNQALHSELKLENTSAMSSLVIENIFGASQKKANVAIKVSATDKNGKNKYTVNIQKKDLTKNNFVVYRNDKKNNPVMVDNKKNNVKVSTKRDLTVNIAKSGNYQLQNKSDAAKTDKKIMKTVTPKKSTVTVSAGKKTTFAMASKCDKANISKITYSSNSASVKVDKKGTIKATSSGTAKVTANVTMQNGAKKKVQMKVKVS